MTEKSSLSLFINNKFSFLGMILALLGILLCYHAMQIDESQYKFVKQTKSLEKEKHSKFSFHLFGGDSEEVNKEEIERQKRELQQKRRLFRISGGGLGLIALTLGIIGSRKKEHHFVVEASVILGAIAIGWELFIVLVVITILGIIIANA